MDYLQALILSFVEGITEFLPISSTGHLILTSKILNIPQTEFVKSFEIMIQLGAILSVVIIYWKTITTNFQVWQRILSAFIPTAVLGFVLYKFIKSVLLGNILVTILALFLGGILLIILEKLYQEKEYHLDDIAKLSIKKAFLIGIIQSFSMIPGVSRAAATIFGGLFLGLKRESAVEFSFLLAIPTMFAATALDLKTSSFSFSSSEWSILAVGFIGAFITAYLTVKFFLKFVQTHTFISFGVYRIILSIFFWILIVN